MFINKTTEDEFLAALERGLDENYSFEEDLYKSEINKALDYLKSAQELLNTAGFAKEATMVGMVTEVCEPDESMDGLTSDKMLKNLEEKGWVFNADDKDFEDEEDEEIEVED